MQDIVWYGCDKPERLNPLEIKDLLQLIYLKKLVSMTLIILWDAWQYRAPKKRLYRYLIDKETTQLCIDQGSKKIYQMGWKYEP